MSVNITNGNIPALASATSANGTARNGATFATNSADIGTIAVMCTASITTSSVLATFKVQSSTDNTTWFDVVGLTTATDAGTGNPVTTTRVIIVPIACASMKSIRVVATLSGAATGVADVTSAVYQFVPFGGLFSKSVPT